MIITADGTYGGEPVSANSSAVKAWGNFGGGVLSIGFITDAGFVAYADADASFSSQGEAVILHGFGEKLAFSLTGSTDAVLNVEAREIRGK